MIIIKSFGEIYESIKSKFYNKTKLDIEKGSVIDMFISSISSEIEEAHQTIEDNKKLIKALGDMKKRGLI